MPRFHAERGNAGIEALPRFSIHSRGRARAMFIRQPMWKLIMRYPETLIRRSNATSLHLFHHVCLFPRFGWERGMLGYVLSRHSSLEDRPEGLNHFWGCFGSFPRRTLYQAIAPSTQFGTITQRHPKPCQ